MQAINNKDYDKTKLWLIYWVVFGFFTAFAKDARVLFFFLSMKSYNVLRILFYLFLFHPKTNGAAFIYKYFLRRRFSQVQSYLSTPKDS
jgi:hypothetical protein